ncbi:hypothetical protein MKX01_010178, partial [Papaver californicum]
ALIQDFSKEPESEAQLKVLLPDIVSSLDSCKSVIEIIEELKKYQLVTEAEGMLVTRNCLPGGMENEALQDLVKRAPFSHCITTIFLELHLSRKKRQHIIFKYFTKSYNCIAVRFALRSDFAEGVRAVLVDKDQKPNWKPSRVEDVDSSEEEALFKPFHQEKEELKV